MKLPPNIERVTLSHGFEGTTSYPPLGFHPFFEHQLGNGDTPIWCIRHQLGLGFGGAKENADYPLHLGAIERYIEQGRIQKALTLMQRYSELMSYETVSFQERYGFDQREFRMRQLEISSRLPGGARKLSLSREEAVR